MIVKVSACCQSKLIVIIIAVHNSKSENLEIRIEGLTEEDKKRLKKILNDAKIEIEKLKKASNKQNSDVSIVKISTVYKNKVENLEIRLEGLTEEDTKRLKKILDDVKIEFEKLKKEERHSSVLEYFKKGIFSLPLVILIFFNNYLDNIYYVLGSLFYGIMLYLIIFDKNGKNKKIH